MPCVLVYGARRVVRRGSLHPKSLGCRSYGDEDGRICSRLSEF